MQRAVRRHLHGADGRAGALAGLGQRKVFDLGELQRIALRLGKLRDRIAQLAGGDALLSMMRGEGGVAIPRDLVMAAGAGDQRLYVIASHKLVVVRQARLRAESRWSDAEFVRLVLNDSTP